MKFMQQPVVQISRAPLGSYVASLESLLPAQESHYPDGLALTAPPTSGGEGESLNTCQMEGFSGSSAAK